MKITKLSHRTNAYGTSIKTDDRYSQRIGFWATVKSVDAINNRVDVLNDQELIFKSIPVSSKEWVNDSNGYVSGERNLPLIGSRVFVLIPDGDLTSAFILCSGFPSQEKSLHGLFAANNSEVNQKINVKEIKTQGGWDIQEDYKSGKIEIKDNKNTINITLTPDSGINITATKEINLTTTSSTDKTSIGNNNLTVGKLVSDLLGQLSTAFVTGQASVLPDFTTAINLYKEQWDSFYK